MEQYLLSNEEKTILKEYGTQFQKWKETDIGKKELQQHRDHENYFKLKLSSENLSKITKAEIIDIYKHLWASQFWKNKDWNINKIIEENGLDSLKKELHLLLYGNEIFEKRYDSFRKRIKGLGISTISEILNMVFPEKFCLWNNVTKTVLNLLKLKDNLSESFFKNNYISGKEYSQCITHISTIKNELSINGINDFVELDMFFWYIHENSTPENRKKDSKLGYDKVEQNELQENNTIDLENLIFEFDKNREVLGKIPKSESESMKYRSEFISKFPTDKILEIEIDKYIIGKKVAETNEINKNTFCYILEYGLPGFGGIGSGSPKKFGIYYNPKEERYIYDNNKFRSNTDAYQKIIFQINALIESGKQFTRHRNWKQLSDIFEKTDTLARHVKSQILNVYFPQSLSLINSHKTIKEILKVLFQLSDEQIKEEFLLNKKTLWGLKQNHAIMKKWSNFDYSYFVWYAWKNYSNRSKNILSSEEKSNDRTIESSIKDKNYILDLKSLSKTLFMPIEKLKIIEELLEEKKQIIFYGPPGTSKTYVAKKFSEYFTQDTENIEIIQFHQSYSYEDFIEGIKPKLSETEKTIVGFEKKEGIFKHLAHKCLQNLDKKFVLIIDEINRGNISKIFGELIYLLEYRNENESIHLTYSPTKKFYIPDNLYLIATMNSADRSIAFVDYALRRRFYFIDFYPDANGEILSKWLKKNSNINEIILPNIVELLTKLNAVIEEHLGREYEIGYSYFMKENLNYKHLERIKEYAIMPLI